MSSVRWSLSRHEVREHVIGHWRVPRAWDARLSVLWRHFGIAAYFVTGSGTRKPRRVNPRRASKPESLHAEGMLYSTHVSGFRPA